MSAIDNMPMVACFWTWIIGKWIIMDKRLGGVDNICVLRRRTARKAVTRPTTGNSEGIGALTKRALRARARYLNENLARRNRDLQPGGREIESLEEKSDSL